MTPAPPASAVPAPAVDRLFVQAEAGRWGVTAERFAEAVRQAVAKLAPAAAPPPRPPWPALHAQDLALALGCADGHDAAWEHFVLTYRPELYRAARAMTDEATGRELADSLYADLFGLTEQHGVRRSLFRYYHGRAKLSTWLRSVLAQRHVDLVRTAEAAHLARRSGASGRVAVAGRSERRSRKSTLDAGGGRGGNGRAGRARRRRSRCGSPTTTSTA